MAKKLSNMEIIRRAKQERYVYVKNDDDEIEKRYVYTCCMCGKEIIEYRPVRFVKQLFGYGKHKQYYSVRNYDFCNECYSAIDNLLFKWKRLKRKSKEGI